MIGTPELLLILGGVILLFGAGAIPKLFRSLGKAKSEFRKGLAEGEREDATVPEKQEQKTG